MEGRQDTESIYSPRSQVPRKADRTRSQSTLRGVRFHGRQAAATIETINTPRNQSQKLYKFKVLVPFVKLFCVTSFQFLMLESC